MAVPLAVVYCTVTVCVLAADRLTVKTAFTGAALPSVTVTSPIETVGGGAASSFVMVPSALAVARWWR